MFLWCGRDGWRQGATAILIQLLLLTIARCVIFKNPLSSFSASWLGLLNRGSLRAVVLSGAFSVCKLVFTLAFQSAAVGICLYNAHLLLLLLPLIYTGASLIDDSVKGQYMTKANKMDSFENRMHMYSCHIYYMLTYTRPYSQFFVLPSSHEEFSSQFEEYILPISVLVIRSREFHVLMVQGLQLKENKLPSSSEGVNSELHVSLNTGEFVF